MELKDRLNFRELQLIFFTGMSENPTDTNRLEQGLNLLEKFVDKLIARECSKIVSGMAVIKHDGKIKN